MTQILHQMGDEYPKCEACKHWLRVLWVDRRGEPFIADEKRRCEWLGVCTFRDSEHHGHVISTDHQACGHLKR